MTSLFCIRDAGGVRRYRTYLSREQAEQVIEREEAASPGCRAPLSVVEYVEATPTVRAADHLLHACDQIWNAGLSTPGSYSRAFGAIDAARREARP